MERLDPAEVFARMPEPHPEDMPTYACRTCLDTALISRPKTGKRGEPLQDVAWYCSCEAGQAAESGHWFDRIYPETGPRRAVSVKGMAAFRAYCASSGYHGHTMEQRVERLRQRYEKARSRKLDEDP